jgi:hypothetical protein
VLLHVAIERRLSASAADVLVILIVVLMFGGCSVMCFDVSCC